MSKEISGRHIEKEKFNESLNSHRSELIAVYGRRRIGKTYLIREYFSKNLLFSFSGLRDGVKQNQIENFMIELRTISNKFQDSKPENWLQALDLLKQYLKGFKETKKKKIYYQKIRKF